MKKTLIFYKPEYADLAIKLRDNYRAHDHAEADIVSEEEHDDIEYAEKMHYDEAVFIEDSDTVTMKRVSFCIETALKKCIKRISRRINAGKRAKPCIFSL